MNEALPHADPADPRLLPIVRAALLRQGLDDDWESTVVELATGETSPSSMRCCGSGCRPCVQELLQCAVAVLRAVNDPQEEARLLRPKGVRGRLRSLAGRAVRKLRK